MQLKEFSLDGYLEKLEDVVNIDSGSFDKEGVEEVALYFKKLYDQLGLYTKLHYINENAGPALEVRNNPDSEKVDILLLGHMDTVFSKGTVKDRPFSTNGNMAYGPGVIDMKAGLMSIYYAIKELKDEFDGKVNICILHNPDEEISSRYSRSMIEEIAKNSNYALILEAARVDGELVYKRKGLAKYKITFTGKAAHSGVDPENGISAINELAYYVEKLHDMNNYDVGTSVNVGIIEGGTQANVIAESASLTVDLRYTDINEFNKIINQINELVENPITKGIKVEVEQLGQRPPMNPSEKTKRVYKLIEEVGEDVGVKVEWKATGGGSDANFTAALGVPTVDGLAPIGGADHGVDEYMEIDSIEPRLKLLVETMRRLPNL
ncbi:MAG TPA: M20 family metallopeptidase [Tissierellaceae bacterium]